MVNIMNTEAAQLQIKKKKIKWIDKTAWTYWTTKNTPTNQYGPALLVEITKDLCHY